jgi:tRNA G18 (ribose-2'-O)-methylase SpoU
VATLIPVTDLADPRVEGYRNLRDRDLRGTHGGRFVAEGESVIKVLLTGSQHEPESLLVAENRLEALRPLAERHDLPVYVAPPALMETIVGFPIHRGLLALGRRSPPVAAADRLAARPGLVLGLAGIANHDNVGGIFRNAAAFGVGVALCDTATADPFYRKALRVSVGGVLRVGISTVPDPMAMVEVLGDAGYRVLALSPAGGVRLDRIDRRGPPLALLLGAEGPGLPPAVLERAETVRIDMAAGFDSLNVATTSGIALYELTR